MSFQTGAYKLSEAPRIIQKAIIDFLHRVHEKDELPVRMRCFLEGYFSKIPVRFTLLLNVMSFQYTSVHGFPQLSSFTCFKFIVCCVLSVQA